MEEEEIGEEGIIEEEIKISEILEKMILDLINNKEISKIMNLEDNKLKTKINVILDEEVKIKEEKLRIKKRSKQIRILINQQAIKKIGFQIEQLKRNKSKQKRVKRETIKIYKDRQKKEQSKFRSSQDCKRDLKEKQNGISLRQYWAKVNFSKQEDNPLQ